jgi:hypothetical protein
MNPYFYSLGMLVTGRMVEHPYLSAMDVLAWCIEDEEREPPKAIAFLLSPPSTRSKA